MQDGTYLNRVAADISPNELAQMRRLVQSGLQKSQKKAAEMGVTAAQEAGLAAAGGAVGAAIGTMLMPGVGTAIGAALGSLMYRASRQANPATATDDRARRRGAAPRTR